MSLVDTQRTDKIRPTRFADQRRSSSFRGRPQITPRT